MSETAGSERSEANENSHPGTMTTGEAAEALGVSVQAVRRMCDAGVLRFAWSDPTGARTDARGNTLRGHRSVLVESVAHLRAAQADAIGRGADPEDVRQKCPTCGKPLTRTAPETQPV